MDLVAVKGKTDNMKIKSKLYVSYSMLDDEK